MKSAELYAVNNMAGASAISGDVLRPDISGSVVDATIPAFGCREYVNPLKN